MEIPLANPQLHFVCPQVHFWFWFWFWFWPQVHLSSNPCIPWPQVHCCNAIPWSHIHLRSFFCWDKFWAHVHWSNWFWAFWFEVWSELSVRLFLVVIFWLKYSYDSVFIDWLVFIGTSSFLLEDSFEAIITFFVLMLCSFIDIFFNLNI